MSIGAGIAIAGIWLAVGASAFSAMPPIAMVLGLCAIFATGVVAYK